VSASLIEGRYREMREALLALRLEAPAAVVDDVTAKVDAVVSSLVETIDSAIGIAGWNSLDGRTYSELVKTRNVMRGA
jgi:hypothetical protein